MLNRSATRLVAVLLPAMLLVPAAAHAERAVLRDATNDVVKFDIEASEAAGAEVVVPTPVERSVDLTRVGIDHRADVLRVTIRVRDLRSNLFDMADVRLRSRQRLWGVEVIRSGRQTYTALTRGHRESQRACGGLITTVDEEAEAIVVSVPTVCIEDPRWVRVGVALFSEKLQRGSGGVDEAVPYWDEAGVEGFEDDSVEVRGPKVRRG